FDLEKSRGSWIHDEVTGDRFVDFYTFFASLPLGFAHPAFDEPENQRRLAQAARYKPSNSDAHTEALARFVDAFGRRAMPEGFRHLFFVEGGALAIENALKAAFDWKVRRNLARGRGEIGTRVLHFREAFHGRSGYTLSLTNTLPVKTMYFPKFDWPRVSNPKLRFPIDAAEEERVAREEEKALAEIEAAFERHPHDIAAIIIEPIQGEGGDNHFRPEFLRALRRVADEHDALYIVDEVQTGFGATGSLWAFQSLGFTPDIVCFGKKTQVCGLFAGPRIDEVEENVFTVSSRINSTWGGGLVDMVRCEIILDVIEREPILENVTRMGEHFVSRLRELEKRYPDLV
ncbi:MAG TPA: L-lysine 6-transaminase, partial [Planctomycetota bacterium]|nr:L-lysine 6-transaminase [Planctomycetota bacterium]